MIERTLTDIPSSDVDEVIEDFLSEGCTATKTQQADGNWAVSAVCPLSAS